MYCPILSDERSAVQGKALDTGRLLRSLGVTGRLLGYQYVIHIVEQILKRPEEHHFLTKSLYPETAKHFQVSYTSVERAIRTLVQTAWQQEDRSGLEYLAGHKLARAPTNGEFIDMVAAYMRYQI